MCPGFGLVFFVLFVFLCLGVAIVRTIVLNGNMNHPIPHAVQADILWACYAN